MENDNMKITIPISQIGIVLVVLKSTYIIDWSWWLVMLPFYWWAVFIVILIIVKLIISVIESIIA